VLANIPVKPFRVTFMLILVRFVQGNTYMPIYLTGTHSDFIMTLD